MQRVGSMKGVGVALIVASVLAVAGPARAECAVELATLRAKLPQVHDAKRQEEARFLIEKASIDQQHGRLALCEAALARASTLMK